MPETSKLIVEYASYRLVNNGYEYHIESDDGSMSSPLHPTLVEALIAYPRSLLDIQLQCPTPRIGEFDWSKVDIS